MANTVIHRIPARQRLQPLSVAFIQLPTPTSFDFQHVITTPINRATLGMESPEVGDTAHAILRANQAFRKRPRARRAMPSMSLTPGAMQSWMRSSDANEADHDDALEPPAPLSNPLPSHRLSTDLYDTGEDLENNGRHHSHHRPAKGSEGMERPWGPCCYWCTWGHRGFNPTHSLTVGRRCS